MTLNVAEGCTRRDTGAAGHAPIDVMNTGIAGLNSLEKVAATITSLVTYGLEYLFGSGVRKPVLGPITWADLCAALWFLLLALFLNGLPLSFDKILGSFASATGLRAVWPSFCACKKMLERIRRNPFVVSCVVAFRFSVRYPRTSSGVMSSIVTGAASALTCALNSRASCSYFVTVLGARYVFALSSHASKILGHGLFPFGDPAGDGGNKVGGDGLGRVRVFNEPQPLQLGPRPRS